MQRDWSDGHKPRITKDAGSHQELNRRGAPLPPKTSEGGDPADTCVSDR